MIKKIVTLMLLFIVMAVFCVPVAHATQPRLSAINVIANDTANIQMPIELSNNSTGFAGLTFSFKYNTKLILKDVQRGKDLPESFNFTLQNNYTQANPCKVVIDGITGEKFDGEIAVLIFEAKKNNEKFLDVELLYNTGDVYDGDLNDINLTVENGYVEFETQQPTDDYKGNSGSGSKKPNNKSDKNNIATTEQISEKTTFVDVTLNDWFYSAVNYVTSNRLMNGVSDKEFMPNQTMSRAMLVTVLYRNEKQPAVNDFTFFVDFTKDDYYYNAVIWAQQNGIVNGISQSEFAPDSNVSREQIAAIMYRYAKFKNYDVNIDSNLDMQVYSDFANVSQYAVESIQYAVSKGLIKGKTYVTLNPKDYATRAEMATILERFIEQNK